MVMFAEVRKDGQWHKVGKEFISTYEEMDGILTDRVFDGRNKKLDLFLVSESNIFEMPNDASDEIKNHVVFKHYASRYCYTLRELLNLNWDKEVYSTGYISQWQYERLKNNGIEPVNILNAPRRDCLVASHFMMDMIIKYPSLADGKKCYVEYQYDKHTMKEQCYFFCNVSIPKLIELIPDGGTADDVRIIFSI